MFLSPCREREKIFLVDIEKENILEAKERKRKKILKKQEREEK